MPLLSICIPAYKRPENIKRLLLSVQNQSFQDYEVVITDDSPDDSVKNSLKDFSGLPIFYHKNSKALGTPANWNFCISNASGEWIKIMHDDDWFATGNALEQFSEKTKQGSKFIFSAYSNIYENGSSQKMFFPLSWRNRILHNPVTLLPRNVIGPPSVALLHRSIKEQYDERLKWRVDIEFYMRVLQTEKAFEYIDEPLINVGISGTQVTNFCIDKPEVELPEGLILLEKYGTAPLKNILVYDAWWRILRNVGIRSKEQLFQYSASSRWPKAILKMANDEARLPEGALRFGPFSKLAMSMSYFFNRRNL